MYRYAVLWDIDSAESRPVGIALERGDHVYVDVAEEYGLEPKFSGEYRVLQPDMSEIIYRPGDPLYFDQVLLDVSRMFAIKGGSHVQVADSAMLMSLVSEHVLRPLSNTRVGEYGRVAAPFRRVSSPPTELRVAIARSKHRPANCPGSGLVFLMVSRYDAYGSPRDVPALGSPERSDLSRVA